VARLHPNATWRDLRQSQKDNNEDARDGVGAPPRLTTRRRRCICTDLISCILVVILHTRAKKLSNQASSCSLRSTDPSLLRDAIADCHALLEVKGHVAV